MDVSVYVPAEELERFGKKAAELGAPVVADPVPFAERSRIFPLRLPGGTVVDFMLATLPFELGAIERARIVEYEGIQIRVVTPEDLIIYKIVSDRPQDYLDVVGILRRQSDLNVAELTLTIQGWSQDLAEDQILDRWGKALKQAGR